MLYRNKVGSIVWYRICISFHLDRIKYIIIITIHLSTATGDNNVFYFSSYCAIYYFYQWISIGNNAKTIQFQVNLTAFRSNGNMLSEIAFFSIHNLHYTHFFSSSYYFMHLIFRNVAIDLYTTLHFPFTANNRCFYYYFVWKIVNCGIGNLVIKNANTHLHVMLFLSFCRLPSNVSYFKIFLTFRNKCNAIYVILLNR